MSDSAGETLQFDWDGGFKYTARFDPEGIQDVLEPVAKITDDCILEIDPPRARVRTADAVNVVGVDVTTKCVREASGSLDVPLFASKIVDDWPGYYNPDIEDYVLEVDTRGDEVDGSFHHETEGIVDPGVFEPLGAVESRQIDEWPEPDDGYEYEFTAPATRVRGVLGSLADTDCGVIRLTPGDGQVLVEAIDDWRVEDEDIMETWHLDADVTPGESVLYTANYVSDIMDGMWPEGKVSVRFGPEKLIELTNGGLRYVLANRVAPPEVGDEDE